jgi:hypothetical protein
MATEPRTPSRLIPGSIVRSVFDLNANHDDETRGADDGSFVPHSSRERPGDVKK